MSNNGIIASTQKAKRYLAKVYLLSEALGTMLKLIASDEVAQYGR